MAIELTRTRRTNRKSNSFHRSSLCSGFRSASTDPSSYFLIVILRASKYDVMAVPLPSGFAKAT
jgi:hypothetical protein